MYVGITQISCRASVLEENGDSHLSYLSVRSCFKRRHGVYLENAIKWHRIFKCFFFTTVYWVLAGKEMDEKLFKQNATFC